MATPDSIGTTSCCNCDREVFVRKNRGGFAYYRCEGCGVSVQHHILRHSASFIEKRVKLEAEPVANTGKKPEKPAPAAAAKPAAPAPEKPAKRGLLSDFMAGGA